MITKIKKPFICVALVLVLVLSGSATLILKNNFNASAQASAQPATTTQYTDVYYYTDNPDSESYYQNFLQSIVSQHPGNLNLNLNYFQHDDWFKILYESGEFNNISNSFVIIEIDSLIDEEISDILYDVFSSLNNCKIMFICGTNEGDFEDSGFLNYVDIHINKDLLQPFMYNVFMDAIELYQGIEGSVILVDESLSTEPFYEWFLDFIIYMYEEVLMIDIPSYVSRDTLLSFSNIDLIFYNYNGTGMYNKTTETPLSYSSGLDFYYSCNGKPIYAICTTWLGDDAFEQGIMDFLTGCQDQAGYDLPVFMLIQEGELNNPAGVRMFVAGLTSAEYNDWLEAMIFDFIMGNSLAQYNNWPGRCGMVIYGVENQGETFKLPYGDGDWNFRRVNLSVNRCYCDDCNCITKAACREEHDCDSCLCQ